MQYFILIYLKPTNFCNIHLYYLSLVSPKSLSVAIRKDEQERP